ncbi:hypothetical protein [Paenibacillus sp. 1P07SE]|uniref:hypothetical protein n=1 Tax=Paenibacillus sp. 1P07SE TaxID=3132209 RepID=UPI0039A5110A
MPRFLQRYGLLILAGIILLGGIGASAAAMLVTVVRMERIVLSLDTGVSILMKPGKYQVFREFELHGSLLPFSATFTPSESLGNQVRSLHVQVFNDQQELRVLPDTSTTYTVNGTGGQSVYRFQVEEEGWYTVALTLDDEGDPGSYTLRKDFMSDLFLMLKQMGIVLLAFLICGTAGTIVCVRSFRAERHLPLGAPQAGQGDMRIP